VRTNQGERKNSNLQTMFVGVRFGVFLHKRVQSVHACTVTVVVVIENRSIEAKEWNPRKCLTANQKKHKSNNLKHCHICIDIPCFSLLSDLTFSENKLMNELKATHTNVPAAKEPSKILFHESNDGISPKRYRYR